MKYIIIDKNEETSALLKSHCARIQDLDLISEVTDGDFGEKKIQGLLQVQADLCFIHPDSFGLESIIQFTPLVACSRLILYSDEGKFAFEAFESGFTDYIQKPLEFSRLALAVERARIQLSKSAVFKKSEVYIRFEGKLVRLEHRFIKYVETKGDYSFFYTTIGTFPIYASLKHIAENLDLDRFIKIHRSFIVNLDHIADIQDSTMLIGDKLIPISRSNRPILMSKINVI